MRREVVGVLTVTILCSNQVLVRWKMTPQKWDQDVLWRESTNRCKLAKTQKRSKKNCSIAIVLPGSMHDATCKKMRVKVWCGGWG